MRVLKFMDVHCFKSFIVIIALLLDMGTNKALVVHLIARFGNVYLDVKLCVSLDKLIGLLFYIAHNPIPFVLSVY